MAQGYYFSRMSRAEQEAYAGMLEGFTSLSTEFAVRKLGNKELSDVLFRLRLDEPSIFYVSGFQYKYAEQSDYVRMQPDYLFDKKKVKELKKALESRVSRLIRQAEGRSQEEKEEFVHRFICENVTYDKLKKQYSHEIIGPLQQGVGVCEGIAKTVKLLCSRLGLESIIAVSEADPDRGVRYRHAWNLIKLGNSWYHLDATFDNSLGRYGAMRFDYYNLSDKQLFRDHRPLVYPIPACGDSGKFYYKEKKLSFTKTEEIGKRLKAVLRKGTPYYVFHWRGGGFNRELLAEIYREAAQAAAERGKYVKLSVNIPQAVMEISILDHRSEREITEEEANEGEAGEERTAET